MWEAEVCPASKQTNKQISFRNSQFRKDRKQKLSGCMRELESTNGNEENGLKIKEL